MPQQCGDRETSARSRAARCREIDKHVHGFNPGVHLGVGHVDRLGDGIFNAFDQVGGFDGVVQAKPRFNANLTCAHALGASEIIPIVHPLNDPWVRFCLRLGQVPPFIFNVSPLVEVGDDEFVRHGHVGAIINHCSVGIEHEKLIDVVYLSPIVPATHDSGYPIDHCRPGTAKPHKQGRFVEVKINLNSQFVAHVTPFGLSLSNELIPECAGPCSCYQQAPCLPSSFGAICTDRALFPHSPRRPRPCPVPPEGLDSRARKPEPCLCTDKR